MIFPRLSNKLFLRGLLFRFLIFGLIFSWIFSGWPQIQFNGEQFSVSFPPEIQVVRAAVAIENDATENNCTNASTCAVTLNVSGTATMVVVAVMVRNDETITSVTDGDGDTYSVASTSGTNPTVAIYYATTITANASKSITANLSASTADTVIDAYTLTGTATSSPIDATATNTGTSAALNANITTNNADSLIAFVAGMQTNATLSTYGANQVQRGNIAQGGQIKYAAANTSEITTSAGNNDQTASASKSATWRAIAVEIKVAPPVTTTIGDGTDPGDLTVAPESGIIDLDAVTFIASADADSVTAATVTLGSGDSDNLSEVRITNDDGSTTYFSAISNPASDTLNFSGGTPIPVTTSSVQFKVRITPETHANMPAPNGAEYAITGTITSFTSTNSQLGTDTNSATITVDNLSPNDATSTSGSVISDTSITINWTTSNSTDYNRSIVLRWQAATPGADVPAEGADYSLDATIGGATVACVENTGTASTAYSGVDGSGADECSSTPLSADTQYSYKHFEKDDNGNWNTGVTNASSPLTTTGGAATTLTFSISDNTIGFGTLDSGNARFANGAGTGSGTEVEAHTLTASTNATNGYTITVNGSTLTSGSDTVTAIGSSNTASSPGTEQFGLRMTATGGNGAVSAPYAAAGFALDTAAFPDQIASDPDGDDVSTTYSVRYLANITAQTEAGSYISTLTYIVTGTF